MQALSLWVRRPGCAILQEAPCTNLLRLPTSSVHHSGLIHWVIPPCFLHLPIGVTGSFHTILLNECVLRVTSAQMYSEQKELVDFPDVQQCPCLPNGCRGAYAPESCGDYASGTNHCTALRGSELVLLCSYLSYLVLPAASHWSKTLLAEFSLPNAPHSHEWLMNVNGRKL